PPTAIRFFVPILSSATGCDFPAHDALWVDGRGPGRYAAHTAVEDGLAGSGTGVRAGAADLDEVGRRAAGGRHSFGRALAPDRAPGRGIAARRDPRADADARAVVAAARRAAAPFRRAVAAAGRAARRDAVRRLAGDGASAAARTGQRRAARGGDDPGA